MSKIPPNIACPICKGKVRYDVKRKELVCYFDGLAYPVVDDIPVMLLERARRLALEEKEKRI
jgi:uncharacterized protein